jgi:hypothetical protein
MNRYYYRIKRGGGSTFLKVIASPAFGSQEGGKASPIINLQILPPKQL